MFNKNLICIFIINKPIYYLGLQVAGFEYLDVLYGTRAKINIYEPKVKNNSKDLSASWIQINKIIKAGVADGIGAGSWVYPSYSGDSLARFHVAWVIHNYFLGCAFFNLV